MAELTGTDVAAWCAAPGWVRWAHSTRDGMAHAFPVEDSQQGRWLRATCSHTVPPAALGPATVVGPRCPRCMLLAVATAGTAAPCVLAPPSVHHHPRVARGVSNGHGGPGTGAAVAAARPVVLVRYRPGVTGETARTVHVVPLPTDRQAGAVGALCGAALMLANIETVTPGEGMPCTVCVVTQALGTSPAGEPPAGSPHSAEAAGLAAGGVAYQAWGWPVTLHRDQVQLSLHLDVSALAIPVPLCTEVTKILTQRRCPAPVLGRCAQRVRRKWRR